MTAAPSTTPRTRIIQIIRLLGVGVAVAFSAASDCGSGPTDTSPVGFTLAITQPIADIPRGTQASITVTIVRQGSFTGAVSLTGLIPIAGTTVSAATIPSGSTSTTMTLTVDIGAAPGRNSVVVTGAATGYQSINAGAAFTVLAPGTFNIVVNTFDLHVNPGGTFHVTLKVVRTTYTQQVSLAAGTASPAAAFVTTLTPTATTDGSVDNIIDVSIFVPTNVVPGDYFVPVIGTGLGAPDITYRVLVTVQLPGFHLTVTPPAPIIPGSSGTMTVSATRDPGFTGAIAITGTAPTGVTIAPGSISASGTQTTLQVTVASSLVAGAYSYQVLGSAPGVSDTGLGDILVAGYSLNVLTAPLNVTAGTSATDAVNIVRTNFTGAVTVTATSDPGITITASPSPTTANQTTLTVTVAGGVSAGTHSVSLQGSAVGLIIPPTTFAVVVGAGATNTSWTFCPVTGLPLWVAVQDGQGSAAWNRVTGSGNTYPFLVSSGTGGIAYVVQNLGVYEMHIFYGTQAELQAQGALLCSNSGSLKTINGSATNTGTAAHTYIGLGSASSITTPATGGFSLLYVAPGPLDLVAATVDGQTLPAGLKMLLQRSINPADNSTLAALDFSAGFAASNATLTFANALGQVVMLTSQYQSTSGVRSTYFAESSGSSTAASRQFFGVPASQQQAGDLHYISAQAFTGTGFTTSYRTAGLAFSVFGPQTLTFGAVLNAATVTSLASTPQARLRASVATQSDYTKLWQVDYDQSSTGGKSATIQMTAGYRGTTGTVQMDIPDFTAVSGWNSVYGLVGGSTVQWKVTASNWSTSGGVTFPVLANGATFSSATAQGIVTP